MVTTAPTHIVTVDMGWGWYDKYYFRGVDVLKSVSPTPVHDGVIDSRLNLTYTRQNDAFSMGLGYIQALQRQVTRESASQVPPNSNTLNNERFSVAPEERYTEYDLYLAYSRMLIPNMVQGTVGYNHYQFSNDQFWVKGKPINFADEATVRLDYLNLPYVHPSLFWAHDFDGFQGDYLELRADSGFDIYKRGPFSIRLEPYADISYDLHYNGNNDGWNAAEFGLNIPFHLNSFLTLAGNVNYTKEIDKTDNTVTGKSVGRTNDGFWAGITLDAAWGTQSAPAESTEGGKQLEQLTPVSEDMPGLWEVTVDGEYRQVQYNFSGLSLDPFAVSKLSTARASTVLPPTGQQFINGSVGTQPPTSVVGLLGSGSGTATFAIKSASQVYGSIANGTERIFLTSKIINEKPFTEGQSHKTGAENQDNVVAPSINLDRELWRNGDISFRLGFGYDYTSSQGDSGTQLARLDSLFQTRLTSGVLYYVDEIDTPSNISATQYKNSASAAPFFEAVIINSGTYANSFAGDVNLTKGQVALLNKLGPQTITNQPTTNELVRVGTFVHSTMNVDAHDLSLPLSMRYDIAPRLHLQLTVAPTLTFTDLTISNNVQARRLSDLKLQPFSPKYLQELKGGEFGSALSANTGGGGGGGGGIIGPGGGGSGGKGVTSGGNGGTGAGNNGAHNGSAASSSTSAQNAALGGGKAGSVWNPSDPGTLIGEANYEDDSWSILFGVSTTLNLIWDLDSQNRYYMELNGGYHWVSNASIGDRAATGGVKLSSIQAGVGFGVRF